MTKKSLNLEVGRRITAIRLQKRMTQQRVAELAGISTPYYSQIENGNKTMSIYVLARIVEALGTSSDYVLFGRMADSGDALSSYISQLTRSEAHAIRGFFELCDQQLCPLEVDDRNGSDTDSDNEPAASFSLR